MEDDGCRIMDAVCELRVEQGDRDRGGAKCSMKHTHDREAGPANDSGHHPK